MNDWPGLLTVPTSSEYYINIKAELRASNSQSTYQNSQPA